VTANDPLGFISHSDVGRHDNGWNHPEHVGRIRAVMRAVRDHTELFTTVEHLEGRHATAAELALAHDPAYVDAVRAMSEAGGGRFDADTTVSVRSGKYPDSVPKPAAPIGEPMRYSGSSSVDPPVRTS
jgi:acetoin utilization deacetylase AcuC-like enzyme